MIESLVPWRVRQLVARRLPEVYHILSNLGAPSNSPEYWDVQLAQSWDDPNRTWPYKNRLMLASTRPSEAILDVGCGTGSLLRHLHSNGYVSLHGLDASRYAIERLTSVGIAMHRGILPQISLPDAAFDVVIASEVLEHVIRRSAFLKEVRRVLKPGGRLYVFVPDDCQGPMEEKEHVRQYDAKSLRQFLSRFLQVESVESFKDDNHNLPSLFALARKPQL